MPVKPRHPVGQYQRGPHAELKAADSLSPQAVHNLSLTVGTLPKGDTPVAWYISQNPDVLEAYQKFSRAQKNYRDRLTELCEISGFDPKTTIMRTGGGTELFGLEVKTDKTTMAWWRLTKDGYWVPRQRTKAERTSEVFTRFQKLRNVPWAPDFVPGMPSGVWMDGPLDPDGRPSTEVYPVKLYKAKDGDAVLAYIGANPDMAKHAFTVGPQWSRLKLSQYHAIKEYQERQRGMLKAGQEYPNG